MDPNDFQLSTSPVVGLDPTRTWAGSQQTLSQVAAAAFQIDAINSNTITLPNNGFNTGDTVVYHDNGNTPITGLQNNGTYTVQSVDANDFELLDLHGNVVPISQGPPPARRVLSTTA